MRFNFNKIFNPAVLVAGAITLLTSCNKDVEDAKPITTAASTAPSISEVISTDANFTILNAAVIRAGINISSLLADRKGVFTFFAPTDAAFIASGIPNAATVSGMPAAQLEAILRYHLVGGQMITSAQIPTTFPNLQLPTQFVLAPPSAAIPPGLRMSIFPSKRGTSFWANNIPLTQTDIIVANGVIHKTAALVAPPSTTIKGLLASNPTKYSILLAAVARADSGQVAGLGKLDSVLNFVPANLTAFAPNNDAFRALFPPGTPDAAIIATLNNHAAFPVQTVRAIIAYHLLGSRGFSVNFAAGPAPVNTQLVIPTNPPTVVPVIVTYGGVTFTVQGLANATPATVLTRDVHAINGVVHEINQVLRPQ
jgi:uncharacterized surface protein with fasciclin (FAS1) repeats